MNIYLSLLASAEAVLALLLLRSLGLLDSGRRILLASVLTGLAFLLRIVCLDYETLDYVNFLSRWVDFFRENGGFAALRYPVGNYNIPYLYFLALFSYSDFDLYLIKLLSIFFDVLLAYSAARLLGSMDVSPARRFGCFFAVLLLPTVMMNGALWGQCDSSYTALALLGLCLALEDRPTGSMVCMALSFGFKLQAVFLLPVCVVLWLHGKYQWKHFLVFPVAYVLLVLPAVLLGRPFWETVTLYFSQTGSIGSGLNYNSPSVFSFLSIISKSSFLSAAAVFAAFLYMLVLLFSALKRRRELNARAVLGYAVLLVIGIPFLLPHMHERYFFLADILTLVMGFASFAALPAAALTEFASYIGYYAYLNMRFLLPMRHGGRALILSAVLAGIFTSRALSGGKENFFKKALDKIR